MFFGSLWNNKFIEILLNTKIEKYRWEEKNMKSKIIMVIAIIMFIVVLILLKNFLDQYALYKYLEEKSLSDDITSIDEINLSDTTIEIDSEIGNEKVDNSNNVVTDINNEINSSYENNLETGKNNIKEESEEMEILEMTSERFEEEVLKSEKTVLIDFYADWCGPCKMMAPVVERIASENTDLKVVKVNIDNEEELAIKYMVMSIPTFIVIKNGEEVNRIVGAVDKAELESIIK